MRQFMEDIKFQLSEDKAACLKKYINFSLEYLFKKTMNDPKISLDKIIKQSLETPRKQVVNVITKIPHSIPSKPIKGKLS